MPTEPIILGPPSKNVDELGLKGFSADLIDGYIDEMGNIVRRPGLSLFCTLLTSASVDGLYWWPEQEWCVAVSGGNTYKITAADGTFSQIAGDTFETGTRVIFSNFGTDLYAANGGKVVKIPNTGNVVHHDTDIDADIIETVTHPVVFDKYLILNEVDTNRFHHSNVNAPAVFDGEYFSAETRTDNIVAMAEEEGELILLGNRSLEPWQDDGVNPFSKIQQGYVGTGTIAPYSFTWCDNKYWVWLDHNRQVVRLNGRTAEVISRSMNKYISTFSTITDALGDFITFNGRPWYILTFKTEGITLALDLSTGFWFRFAWWDTVNSEHDHWRGNCAAICPAWNKVLIGDHSNGKVYELDSEIYQDDSGTLKTLYRTEHINRGTEDRKKICRKLTFRTKRTNVASEALSVQMVVRWRDDGSTTWSSERTVTLGDVGDTVHWGQLVQLGSYYSRQWEFYVTGNCAVTISDIQETYDVGSW